MVDMNGLQKGVIGFGVVVLAVAFIVVLLSNLGNTSGLSAEATNVINNGTQQVGSIVTTWGSIIVLGVIILFVFIGILFGLMALANRNGGR